MRRIVLINLLVFVGLLAALEIAARVYVGITRGSQTAGMKERTLYLSYRPFVMFGPDWDVVLPYSRIDTSDAVCRILLVGGSTAAFFPTELLEAELSRIFGAGRFRVINAASGGYVARQEVVVASLWAPRLRPHVLVSLDGANDLIFRLRNPRPGGFLLDGTYETMLTRPWLAPIVDLLIHSQFYNGLVRLLARNNLGPAASYSDAIPIYIEAQTSLNSLARGLGAARLIVLQPHSGFKSPQSAEEQAFTLYKYREEVVKTLFSETHAQLEQLAARESIAYLDGRFLYEGMAGWMFTDDVHLTQKGYHVLAAAIAGTLANGVSLPPSCHSKAKTEAQSP